MLGVGGGVIMVPAMQFLGVPFKVAVGTSLAAMIPTALTGVIRYYPNGNVNLKVATLLAAGAIIGANIGATFMKYIPDVALKRVFAIVLVYTAYKLFFGK